MSFLGDKGVVCSRKLAHPHSAFKPGSHMTLTCLGHRYRIGEDLSANHNPRIIVPAIDRRLICEGELRQAGGCRQVSEMKIFNVNIIYGRNV